MNETHETRAVSRSRPFEHLFVAVGVAKGEDGTAADERVDPFRFARPVIDEQDLRLAQELRLSISGELISGDGRGANYLLRRNAVALVGEDSHELHATARNDEGLEVVGAQIGEQLQHGLINEIGVGPVEARMAGGREPLSHHSGKFLGAHAAMAHRHDLHEALLTRSEQRLLVARKHSCEGLLLFPFWMLWGERLYPVNGEGELKIDRLLSPERAVVVEGRDAFFWPNEVRRAGFRHPLDKVDDRLLGRSIIPRGKWVVGKRLAGRGDQQDGPKHCRGYLCCFFAVDPRRTTNRPNESGVARPQCLAACVEGHATFRLALATKKTNKT